MQILDIVGDVRGRNILLLQGPMGNFFNLLNHKFMNLGAKTFRIGLNAGDEFFADVQQFTPFKGRIEEWQNFITSFYEQYSIDMIFVFGDCRFYQSKAIEIAKKKGIEVFVFEEGYIRPDFITLERDGVNDNSSLPRERTFYDIVGNFFCFKYPHYQHHRIFSAFLEAFYGVRNFVRKQLYKFQELNVKTFYQIQLHKKYFFVALQTYEDFQILYHSDYKNIEEFIEEVLLSFAYKAPKDKYLVIKHHPMDRGKKDYARFIRNLVYKLGCAERVNVVYDVHLPTLLKNAIGTITINSTVGISSLLHGTPTLCMGRSFYDIEGLTSKGIVLDDFWREYKAVDMELFNKFRCYLIQNAQVNGSFYKLDFND